MNAKETLTTIGVLIFCAALWVPWPLSGGRTLRVIAVEKKFVDIWAIDYSEPPPVLMQPWVKHSAWIRFVRG